MTARGTFYISTLPKKNIVSKVGEEVLGIFVIGKGAAVNRYSRSICVKLHTVMGGSCAVRVYGGARINKWI